MRVDVGGPTQQIWSRTLASKSGDFLNSAGGPTSSFCRRAPERYIEVLSNLNGMSFISCPQPGPTPTGGLTIMRVTPHECRQYWLRNASAKCTLHREEPFVNRTSLEGGRALGRNRVVQGECLVLRTWQVPATQSVKANRCVQIEHRLYI